MPEIAQPATEEPVPETAEARTRAASGLSLRFSARDLVNVALFAVLYFAVVSAVAMLGAINPLVMLLALPLSAIVAGIPFLLFLARVRHAGMVALFGAVVALLYVVTGHPWQSVLVTVFVAVLAELVLAFGRYRSMWAAIWSYTLFTAWYIGPFLPLFLDRQSYLDSPGMQAMGADYVAQFDATVSVPLVLIIVGLSLVGGLLGGLLGAAMVRKHFRKGGLA